MEYLTLQTFSGTLIRYPEWNYFPLAPRLCRLHLTSGRLLDIFPCAQLTHLCISESIGPNSLLQIFTVSCPNLLCAAFNIGSNNFDDDRPTTCVSNHRLRQLVLSGYACNDFVHFFMRFSYQCLSSLRLLVKFWSSDNFDITRLVSLFQAMQNITELHLAAGLFCAPYGNNRASYESMSLGEALPKLKIIVLEMVDTVGKDNIEYFEGLVRSRFLRPSPKIQSTRVEIVFEEPRGSFENLDPSTLQPYAFGQRVNYLQKEGLPRMNNSAEESLYAHLQAYINDNRQTLQYDIVLGQSTNTRWVWSEMSEDLSRWEEAMGFYERV